MAACLRDCLRDTKALSRVSGISISPPSAPLTTHLSRRFWLVADVTLLGVEFLELPGSSHSELHAQYSKNGNGDQLTSVAWLTGQGIYHGSINYGNPSSSGDALIDSAQLLPYPASPHMMPPGVSSKANISSSYATSPNISTTGFPGAGSSPPEIPISIGVTKFHFLSLFGEKLVAICSLDSRLDFEEVTPLVRISSYLYQLYYPFTSLIS